MRGCSWIPFVKPGGRLLSMKLRGPVDWERRSAPASPKKPCFSSRLRWSGLRDLTRLCPFTNWKITTSRVRNGSRPEFGRSWLFREVGMAFEFKLPDLGEGLTEAEIVKWLVKVGDTIQEGQAFVQVET